MASMGLNLDEQKAVERFRSTVVEPSMANLVILDFWAEWCGPCKALTPVLEKVAGEYADKGVVLAKVNVDEEQFIAAQFQVRSIPTVYAMFQGQPVADLTSARSESQLRQVLDQLLAKLPVAAGAAAGAAQQEVGQFLAMGEQALADGDPARAAGIFAQVIEMAPGNGAAHAGLVHALAQSGELERARAALDVAAADAALVGDPQIAAAGKALELAEGLAGNRVDDDTLAGLRAKAQANPADMASQMEFAEAAFASGARDEAADTLLAMIAADREWNEGAARTRLLQLFEAVGLEDAWVIANRRRLSRILFG